MRRRICKHRHGFGYASSDVKSMCNLTGRDIDRERRETRRQEKRDKGDRERERKEEKNRERKMMGDTLTVVFT